MAQRKGLNFKRMLTIKVETIAFSTAFMDVKTSNGVP